MILTHSQEEGSSIYEMAEIFKERLEAVSDGKYQVEIYPANTYGRIAGNYHAVKAGRIEMRIGGNSDSCMDILSWIPAFTDVEPEQLMEKLQPDSPLYALIQEECEQDGCRLLGMMSPMYRVLTSSRKISSVQDFSGLTIRTGREGGGYALLVSSSEQSQRQPMILINCIRHFRWGLSMLRRIRLR